MGTKNGPAVPYVYGEDRQLYWPHQIDSERYGVVIGGQRLFDEDGQLAKAVSAHERPGPSGVVKVGRHFALKSRDDVSSVRTNPPDPTHDDKLRMIYKHLTTGKPVRFESNDVLKAVQPHSIGGKNLKLHPGLVLAEPSVASDYRWTREPATRIWVDATRFIQPDIVGHDVLRPAPGPKTPTVIIEVVHTHCPDESTWKDLLALTLRNHLVMFYLCIPQLGNSSYGRLNDSLDAVLWVRTELYMKDGAFCRNGTIIPEDPSQSPTEQRYAIEQVFANAKQSLLDLQKQLRGTR